MSVHRFKPSKSTSAQQVKTLNVLPKSRMNIICPNTALNPVKMSQSLPKSNLYENLWAVDKRSFDTCNVDTSIATNRILLQCDTPMVFKHYSLVFLEISPSKQFMEFQKGKDYYFICKFVYNSTVFCSSLLSKALVVYDIFFCTKYIPWECTNPRCMALFQLFC